MFLTDGEGRDELPLRADPHYLLSLTGAHCCGFQIGTKHFKCKPGAEAVALWLRAIAYSSRRTGFVSQHLHGGQ